LRQRGSGRWDGFAVRICYIRTPNSLETGGIMVEPIRCPEDATTMDVGVDGAPQTLKRDSQGQFYDIRLREKRARKPKPKVRMESRAISQRDFELAVEAVADEPKFRAAVHRKCTVLSHATLAAQTKFDRCGECGKPIFRKPKWQTW
jgi:hypothetical protein